jgi:RNA polymerase sigma-70 factor (ECF subfamily)
MANLPEPSDDALIRKALCEPESDAFAQLVRRHQSRLRLYLRSLSGNSSIADELAQEALLKVYRSLSRFKFQSSFKTWLMTIARNTFLDQVRLATHVADLQRVTDEAHQHVIEAPCIPDTEDGHMLAIDIERSMQLLSPAEREVIAHCYFADLTMDETSKILGMPLGTVKTHSQRGLKKLRDALTSWQPTFVVKQSK